MFDHATLMLLWWAMLAVLLLGFTLLNGFDLGLAMLLPVLGRTESERLAAIRVVAPGWTARPFWLLLGGGAGMAAWPVYASTFSIHYLALLLSLCALFLRPLGFELRQRSNPRWRPLRDRLLQLAALVPALLFGMAIGDLFTHAPARLLHTDGLAPTLTYYLHPFTLYCGLVSISLLLLHGAALLVMRSKGALLRRARVVAIGSGLLVALLFAAGGLWVSSLDGLLLRTDSAAPDMATLATSPGAWLRNFVGERWLLPAAGVAFALLTSVSACRGWRWLTFAASCATLGAIMATAGLALFPFVLPPSAEAVDNMALWLAAGSHPRLCLLLALLVLALPLLAAVMMRSAGSGDNNDDAPAADGGA